MAQSSKRKTKASGSFSSDSNICSPEGKKPCNSSRKVLDEDDQEKQPNMSDKITAQLETICQTLTSIESRLQNLENIFERVSSLEKSISNFGTELSKLSNKTKEVEKTASDVETAMAFANTEIEELKKKGLAPTYLQDLIKVKPPCRYQLRSDDKFFLAVPKTKCKTFGDRAFYKAGPDLWNHLPLSLRNTNDLQKFKKDLKTHLFRVAFSEH